MAPELVRGRDVDSPTQMILAHVENQPEPPSTIAEFEIPKELDDLLLSCLEKDPDRRPQSAGELADRLARCCGETTWTRESADRWWGKNLPDLQRRV
jgi:serine/threonine protein kinase